MTQGDSQEHFLQEDATFGQKWQALSLNNQSWLTRSARAGSKEVVYEEGITWMPGHLVISSVDPHQIDDQLDRALQWYRGQNSLDEVTCWYLTATPSEDLSARLLARGFEPDGQRHWMWCNLRDLPNLRAASSAFDIQTFETEPASQTEDLPDYPPEKRKVRAAMHRLYPRQVLSLVAFQKNRVVGRCMLNITTGEWGIGSLFAMAVAPTTRNQGIGTTLTWKACELARRMGCHHVMLNATDMGEPVYRRVGFCSLGYRPGWYLRLETLAAPPTNG